MNLEHALTRTNSIPRTLQTKMDATGNAQDEAEIRRGLGSNTRKNTFKAEFQS
jgi:hypothetical protein